MVGVNFKIGRRGKGLLDEIYLSDYRATIELFRVDPKLLHEIPPRFQLEGGSS